MNLWVALCSMDILTTLPLSIHEHEISFHLVMPSTTSFINSLVFGVWIFCFLGYIYFEVFYWFRCEIISFSDSLLCAYRNAIAFYVDVFYSETLLNSFIISNRLCVCVCVCICVVFRFSMYNILSPSTRESFLLPTKLDAFYLFSLIALARTFSAILSRSSGSGPPCLVPDHRRKAFKHSPLSMMLAVLACYM